MGHVTNLVTQARAVSPTAQPTALFKGIVLFTPGGDLVYCIDPEKQNHWHLQLCLFLQSLLGLSEPPHFLVPCFTATIDRWLDPRTQTVHTFAEAYPLVLRHQSLLNALFGCTQADWQMPTQFSEICDPLLIASYRQQFPQLWECHELVARLESPTLTTPPLVTPAIGLTPSGLEPHLSDHQGYVLRLFVSGNNAATERILQTLHRLLETHLNQPYTLKVIDVHKHPEQAELDQVTATPTLLKVFPRPVRRIVGDLNNPAALLRTLR
ncbi:MAG: circadian clock KaiB family protein [Elainella sp. Prado103]|nr:circadian clock KaiB family protein [Elainella sp. Prado103]